MTRPLECRLHVDIARLYASPQLVAGRQRYFRLRGARAVAVVPELWQNTPCLLARRLMIGFTRDCFRMSAGLLHMRDNQLFRNAGTECTSAMHRRFCVQRCRIVLQTCF